MVTTDFVRGVLQQLTLPLSDEGAQLTKLRALATALKEQPHRFEGVKVAVFLFKIVEKLEKQIDTLLDLTAERVERALLEHIGGDTEWMYFIAEQLELVEMDAHLLDSDEGWLDMAWYPPHGIRSTSPDQEIDDTCETCGFKITDHLKASQLIAELTVDRKYLQDQNRELRDTIRELKFELEET